MAHDTRLAASRGKGGLSPSKPRLQYLLQGLPWKLESLRPGKAISRPPLGGTVIFWACTIGLLGHTHVHRHTHNTSDCGWDRRSYRLREGEKGRTCGGRYSLRVTPLPPFLRWYPTYACGLLQEVHARIIPIAQARHTPSLTKSTMASPGSKTGKMESAPEPRVFLSWGPGFTQTFPGACAEGCVGVTGYACGTACRKGMSSRQPRALFA